MTTAPVSGGYTPAPTPVDAVMGGTARQVQATNELDKDAFLQLLVAQLRYQDPTSPMDTSSFMAQTTQLTSMEKLTELAETSRSSFELQQRLASASLVGQQVAWTGSDGTSLSGTVSAVSLAGGTPQLRVGDVDVPLDAVTAVVAAPSTATPATTDPATSPPPATAPPGAGTTAPDDAAEDPSDGAATDTPPAAQA